MFGYITPLKRELKVREFDYFRSYYHGLCYALKDNFGNVPRLTLNYDMTFIGFLLEGLTSKQLILQEKRCIKHPTNKVVATTKTDALDYVSNLSIIFVNYQLVDNINDDHSLKSKIFFSFLKPSTKKIFIEYDNISSIIEKNIRQLSYLEKNLNFNTLDEICHPFADTLGEVLKSYPYAIDEDSLDIRNNLYLMGYSIGKFIYLIDALDDLEDDIKNKTFNPINIIYNKENTDFQSLINRSISDVEFILFNCVTTCSDLLKIIPFKKHVEILDNIINLGMVDKYYEVYKKVIKAPQI